MTVEIEAAPVTDVVAELGEGPVWDAANGQMVWVDILGHQIHRLDHVSGETGVQSAPDAVGAVIPGERGWLAALPDGIRAVDTWELIAELPPTPTPTRANDGKADPWGNLVQGTMGWDGESGAGSLYRIRPPAPTEVLQDTISISNGLDWTEDGHTMYHIDTPTRLVRAYDYHPDRPLGPGRVVLDLTDARGFPDGMCLDADDCLWVALWGGRCVDRYTPDGRIDRRIEVAAERVSSCAFGGPQLDQLYITTASRPGGNEAGDLDGRLFVVEPGVNGRLPNRFGVSA